MPGDRSPDKQHARQPADYLVVGRVVRPHGVRGALLVEPLSRIIESLEPGAKIFLGPENAPARLTASRFHKQRLMISLKGVHDRSQAELLRGQELKIRYDQAEPLDEDEYFYWQVIGLEVVLESGEVLGQVVEILATGANDVYVVRNAAGDERLLPAIAPVVLEVDLEAGRMLVRLLPGL